MTQMCCPVKLDKHYNIFGNPVNVRWETLIICFTDSESKTI